MSYTDTCTPTRLGIHACIREEYLAYVKMTKVWYSPDFIIFIQSNPFLYGLTLSLLLVTPGEKGTFSLRFSWMDYLLFRLLFFLVPLSVQCPPNAILLDKFFLFVSAYFVLVNRKLQQPIDKCQCYAVILVEYRPTCLYSITLHRFC